MIHLLPFLGYGFLFVTLFMTGLWWQQRRTHNAGIVDVGWSGSIPLLVAGFGLASPAPWPRALLFTALAFLWGGRLVVHIHRRSHGEVEDRRYRTLRESWGEHAQRNFFWFFQFQAVAALLFAGPYLLVFHNVSTILHPLELFAAVLFVGAWIGEAAADAQLAAFKANPAHRGKVCAVGLWKYSRHPNYFFEWCIWVAVALAATPAPHGYLAWLCPALMLYFLFKVTGIPATEAQALRSKGEAYRSYQQSTSAFVPWFPKKG
ncbi:MAG TPA: DUF1295 domain-containing protein [Kiritimatiellia bacterium]|nr:DUF1295 domain-containing protein [Kiritimatiellia bacterium]